MIRRLLSYTILVGTLLAWGCSKDIQNSKTEGDYDPTKVAPVTLSGIALATGTDTKAEGTALMPVGQTFRLYAFPKGETSLDKVIATRTYTIASRAGEPVMNSGQTPLYLPIGEVDIFLVGPVQYNINSGLVDEMGNALPPAMVDVASEYGVYPQYGVDLVSSKTVLDVKAGANQFEASPLYHRMAQMEVVVQRPEDATYTDLYVTRITVMNQTTRGSFEFNDGGGQIKLSDEGSETLAPTVREVKAGADYRATMYVLPRDKKQLSIGIFMSCKVAGSTTSVERRMESGVIEEALVPGQMNRFTTHPNISSELIFRLRLMDWENIDMPEVTVPSAEGVLFSYSGMDAPQMINGKMCIPDRSGNGNHGEIVGDIRHDKEGKYYYAASGNAYIKVPDLGTLSEHTLELTAESLRGAKAKAAVFAGADATTALSVTLPNENNDLVFNSTATTITADNYTNDKAWMENLAVYAFNRTPGAMTIYRNGIEAKNGSAEALNTELKNNKLLLGSGSSEPKIKLYAARLSTGIGVSELKNNYKNDIATFAGINISNDATNQKYISQGLILNLDGSSAPVGDRWPDQSEMANHAQINGGITYDGTSKCYKFNGTGYMKLLGSLGTLQEFTVEYVAIATSTTATLMNFSSQTTGGDENCEFAARYMSGSDLMFYAPYRDGGVSIEYPNYLTSSPIYSDIKDKPHNWSLVRSSDGENYRLDATTDGVLIGGTKSGAKTSYALRQMRACFIGCNGYDGTIQQPINTSIYAIRVYNRVLTPHERQHNYQVDKSKYKLVP